MHISEKRKIEAQKRRVEIYNYLVDHPGARPRDVQIKFGLGSAATYNHMKAIRDGWKPNE